MTEEVVRARLAAHRISFGLTLLLTFARPLCSSPSSVSS